jgi:hypothetical protein
MMPPLGFVALTARNRWQVQVMLTRIAYEKELGMKIDEAHVVNVYATRRREYKVEVIAPSRLEPADWPDLVNRDVLYESLKAPSKK